MLKRFISASALVLLVHGMAGTADAFTYDKRTYFTFNQSVALPGVTLPAGTYMFRLADPDTTRRVIQVSDKQGTQSYALLLTMPADRADASKDSEIRFLETPASAPRAVSAWWYVGDRTGYEFIYSKKQLADLNRVGQPEPVAAGSKWRQAAPRVSLSTSHRSLMRTSPGVVEGEGVPPEASADADVEAESQIAQAQPPAQQPPFENEPPPPRRRAVRSCHRRPVRSG